ncbi:hypothetical protein YC2023_071337 [Brassica napus]
MVKLSVSSLWKMCLKSFCRKRLWMKLMNMLTFIKAAAAAASSIARAPSSRRLIAQKGAVS